MFVVEPGVSREVRRQLKIDGEFLTTRTGILLKCAGIRDQDGKKLKTMKLTEEDGVVHLLPSGVLTPTKRIVAWSANPILYEAGLVSLLNWQEPDTAGPPPIGFKAFGKIDIGKLEYLVKAFILDQVVR